jgi:dihydrodipicolinate synthase/N-acetylneuraminate lyase
VDHEKLAERFRTVHAINVTPFREDRGVDYDHLQRNIELQMVKSYQSSASSLVPSRM